MGCEIKRVCADCNADAYECSGCETWECMNNIYFCPDCDSAYCSDPCWTESGHFDCQGGTDPHCVDPNDLFYGVCEFCQGDYCTICQPLSISTCCQKPVCESCTYDFNEDDECEDCESAYAKPPGAPSQINLPLGNAIKHPASVRFREVVVNGKKRMVPV